MSRTTSSTTRARSTASSANLGDKLCELAGYKCEWVKNDWDTIIPNLLSGNYDTIMAGMSITDERKQKIDFTQNYFPPAVSAYVAKAGASADVMKGNVAAQVEHHPGRPCRLLGRAPSSNSQRPTKPSLP